MILSGPLVSSYAADRRKKVSLAGYLRRRSYLQTLKATLDIGKKDFYSVSPDICVSSIHHPEAALPGPSTAGRNEGAWFDGCMGDASFPPSLSSRQVDH